MRNAGERYAQAIEETGFEYKTLRDDKWVASRIDLSRRRDKLTFAHHREVVSLDPDAQDYLLQEAEKQRIPAKAFRQMVRDFRRRGFDAPDLPQGKYNILYVDPPWEISSYPNMEKWPTQLEDKYPTMTRDALKVLRVQDLALDDCVPLSLTFYTYSDATMCH